VLQNVLMGEVAHMDVPGKRIEEGLWSAETSIDWSGGTTSKARCTSARAARSKPAPISSARPGSATASHICEGAEVVRSVLFEYTRVLADVSLYE